MDQVLKLQAEASTLRTLEEVFRWALRQNPRVTPEDVVVQDEYTHDVLFATKGGAYLVFDTT